MFDFSVEEEKAEIFSFVTLYKAIISDVKQGFSMVLLWSEAVDIQQNKESIEAYKFFVYSCRLQTFEDHLDPCDLAINFIRS